MRIHVSYSPTALIRLCVADWIRILYWLFTFCNNALQINVACDTNCLHRVFWRRSRWSNFRAFSKYREEEASESLGWKCCFPAVQFAPCVEWLETWQFLIYVIKLSFWVSTTPRKIEEKHEIGGIQIKERESLLTAKNYSSNYKRPKRCAENWTVGYSSWLWIMTILNSGALVVSSVNIVGCGFFHRQSAICFNFLGLAKNRTARRDKESNERKPQIYACALASFQKFGLKK